MKKLCTATIIALVLCINNVFAGNKDGRKECFDLRDMESAKIYQKLNVIDKQERPLKTLFKQTKPNVNNLYSKSLSFKEKLKKRAKKIRKHRKEVTKDSPLVHSSLRFKWAKTLRGPSEEDEIDAVASDNKGNVYISGKFEDDLVIDGQKTAISSNGKADIMLVKYDKNGNWLWTRHYGGSKEDNIFDADCDNQGNVILSGYFQGSIQFGDYKLRSQGGFDMVVVKVDPSGTVLWARNYGGTGNDGGNEVVIGNNNKILVGAGSYGTFEGIANTGKQDAYLLSLDENGNIEWIQAVKGTGDARAKAVAIDGFGNVYLGGDYRNNNYIENNGRKLSLQKFGGRDAYLMSFTPSGAYRWQKNWGNTGVDFCKGIVTTSQNEIYAVGQFQKNVLFDGIQLHSNNGTKDLFVWKIDSAGDTQWLRHISSPEKLSGAEVAIDTNDNLIFGLGITGATNFQIGNSKLKTVFPCEGIRCPVLIRYDKKGDNIEYISAQQSYNGRFGEIAISNNTAYIDCEVIGGSYIFGKDSIGTVKGSKDAAIIAVKL